MDKKEIIEFYSNYFEAPINANNKLEFNAPPELNKIGIYGLNLWFKEFNKSWALNKETLERGK